MPPRRAVDSGGLRSPGVTELPLGGDDAPLSARGITDHDRGRDARDDEREDDADHGHPDDLLHRPLRVKFGGATSIARTNGRQ
jgi:hypothetical protein